MKKPRTKPSAENSERTAEADFELVIQMSKDFTDRLKAKTLFFVPFFGVLIALLISGREYLTAASVFIKVLCLTTFLAGLLYSYICAKMLDHLSAIGITFNIARNSAGRFFHTLKASDLDTIRGLFIGLQKSQVHERKVFKASMLLLYFCAIVVLSDIYLVRPNEQAITNLLTYLLRKLFSQ